MEIVPWDSSLVLLSAGKRTWWINLGMEIPKAKSWLLISKDRKKITTLSNRGLRSGYSSLVFYGPFAVSLEIVVIIAYNKNRTANEI